ncbi:MAG: response regulator transcription factor [Hyphomicrobium zavarzinii]|jgi:two-component system OmpR family response regulator|uniref:response regulator n=1 Tax=Hyphomicrobium TaxID=81 RepID=UPI00035D6ADE|nr:MULTISPECIES: response regulator transcription factor [Hyphomicrobium]MBL8846225.1 response regulator transcription factor [Hyphomicrobium zavarzinii]WBT38435.1 response regulator transcription factor [Hyphomicrobium sp. DMF-1]HML42650.1 response regulator transcription factor [Hyphomicrobium zavarzinii]
MRILVIEDDPETCSFVGNGLRQAGHTVDSVGNGKDGVLLGIQEDYDLVILDRMLPGLDGLAVARTLRSSGRAVPILFLTALGGINDRVQGLEVGGDDYVVKPFAFSELLARVNALGRRSPMRNEHEKLVVGDLEMDVAHRIVTRGGRQLNLLPRECLLLEILLRSKGRVVLRTMLLERVWGFRFEPKTSVVETYISRLRAKVDKPFKTALIHTVRGCGYSIYEE